MFNKSNIFYIKEDRSKKPKEIFKITYDLLKKKINFEKKKTTNGRFWLCNRRFYKFFKKEN